MQSFILIKGQMEILLATSVCSTLSSLAFISSTAAQKVCLGFPDRSNLYLDFPRAKNDLQDPFDV